MDSQTPEPPVTGHAAIDASLRELDLSGAVGEHADGIQQVHTVLQQVLNPSAEPPTR